MPVALPFRRQFFAIRWFFKSRIEILHYLLILVIQYQGCFMGAVISYDCVICYWCIYADLLTKKFNKKCSAPSKLLLLSFIAFLWSSICRFLGSILKNRKLTRTTTTTNHLMEYQPYWMKVKHTRPFSVDC